MLRLATALQSGGHRVDIVAPGAAGLPEHDALEGVSIRRVRYASDADMTLAYTGTMAEDVRGSWSGRFALFGLLRALRRAVRDAVRAAERAGDPYDVVHAHWWFPAGLALWRATGSQRPPLVITMHGSDVRLAQATAPAHPVMRAVLAQARECTAVSNWLADAILRIAPGTRLRVAPMPVDTRHFSAGHPETSRRGILFVGRLNSQKGLAALLTALAQPALREATLDVVGDGPDAGALQRQAGELGVAARVRWHGALSQPALVPFYQQAICLAVPSIEEGLGLVAVEAQLCGTPVVAYASGGLTDVVRPDAGGSLVMPGDVAALAVSLARLLANPTEALRTGQIAREAMLASFAPDVVAERYAQVYGEAVARG